jgi:ATP-binding cassette subfamily F protein 3
LLEACVDRLWLVANGTVKPFDGDLADYSRFVLSQGAPAPQVTNRAPTVKSAPASTRNRGEAPLKRELATLEAKMNRFQDLIRRIDEALLQASGPGGDALKMAELGQRRGDLERALTLAEETWLELSEQAEA